MASAVPAGIARVGVFVNVPTSMYSHGRRELSARLLAASRRRAARNDRGAEWPVVRAFRFGAEGWTPIEQYLPNAKAQACCRPP